MVITITEQEDHVLRSHAQRLSYELGEDAYHNVVCDVLFKKSKRSIRNICGFVKVSTKYALYKLYRHEEAERRNIKHFINNDPIPQQIGLIQGRQKHEMCRKRLHALIEGNIVYIGVRRTCRACKQQRERKQQS